MKPQVHPEAIKHQVRIRIEDLRKLPYEELAKLPEWSTTDIKFGDTVAKLTIYREGNSGERLTIAVQCRPQGSTDSIVWRGVYAEGFHVRSDGAIEKMADWERLGGYM